VEAAKADKSINEVEVSVFDNCQAVIQTGQSGLHFEFLSLFFLFKNKSALCCHFLRITVLTQQGIYEKSQNFHMVMRFPSGELI